MQQESRCIVPIPSNASCFGTQLSIVENKANDSKDKLMKVMGTDQEYYCKIAEIIGGKATPEEVAEIILLSNTEGHLFHGIKRETYMKGVRENGIQPLSPEGKKEGGTSYWTTGKSIFGKAVGDEVNTFDTTFFDYGHSFDVSGKKVIMNIALTNKRILKKIDTIAVFVPDAHIEINMTVPTGAFHLLRIEIDRDAHLGLSERQLFALAEQQMFIILYKALKENYEVGRETVIRFKS